VVCWHEKNQQHADFNDFDGGPKAGNVACLFHVGAVLCELHSRGAEFFTQDFGVEYITHILGTGTQMRRKWDDLVWADEAKGILHHHDKHVDMDHFLDRLTNKLQDCLEFKSMRRLFKQTCVVSKFQTLPVLLKDLALDLKKMHHTIATRPAYVLNADGKFSLVVPIMSDFLLYFDPHAAGKPPMNESCVTILCESVAALSSFLLREDSLYNDDCDGAVQLFF
jgi:hypothetical protein